MAPLKKFALYCFIFSPTLILLGVITEKFNYSLVDIYTFEEEITEGNKDGFVIGSSKETTFQYLLAVKEKNEGLALNLYYDNESINCIQLPAQKFMFSEVVEYNNWGLIYDAPGKEDMRMEFTDEQLSKIVVM